MRIKNKIFSIKKRVMALGLVLLIFTIGYLSGSHIGEYLTSNLITDGSGSLLLLYRPALEHSHISRLLASGNELKRLAGYYSLLDNKRIDAEFLIERYKKEGAAYIKRSIIWLLGFSNKKIYILDFMAKEYKNGSPKIKREILQSMKRLDDKYLKQFMKDQKIDINI